MAEPDDDDAMDAVVPLVPHKVATDVFVDGLRGLLAKLGCSYVCADEYCVNTGITGVTFCVDCEPDKYRLITDPGEAD